MNTSLQDFDYMRADRRVVAAAADIGAKTIVEGTGQGRRTASYQIWLDGSSLFLRITPGSGHCQDRVSRFGSSLVLQVTAFWVQAIPGGALTQQCHEIIQNRLALGREESVSVGHRRQPLPGH